MTVSMLSKAIFAIALIAICLFSMARAEEETYGPVNLLKTLNTPFKASVNDSDTEEENISAPRSLSARLGRSRASSSHGLASARLYLPSKLIIGQSAEFVISGKPDSWAALAMADKSSGAKEIYEHQIHLGPDRKVVAVGRIPANGILSMFVETPIQGDLIGQGLFFEAAVWQKEDFSDMSLAQPVQSEKQAAIEGDDHGNGVAVAAEPDKKRGLRFVADPAVLLMQRRQVNDLSSGRP